MLSNRRSRNHEMRGASHDCLVTATVMWLFTLWLVMRFAMSMAIAGICWASTATFGTALLFVRYVRTWLFLW